MNPAGAAGFVLAGGQSSRMGRDKALVEFAGRPLIENALSILRDAGLTPRIAGSRSTLSQFAPVIDDRNPGQGPLSGICSALESTEATHAVFPAAVFIAVDQPLIPPSLLIYLLHRAQIAGSPVTIASLHGEPQTFPAVLNRAALPALQAELASTRRACFKAFQSAGIDAIPVEFLAQSGHAAHPRRLPPHHWFLNANTLADLEQIETIARIHPIPARIP